jgi:hypothetical protein
MDFITDLPLLYSYIEIWVIIYRFRRIANFIRLKKNKKKVKDLVLIFIKNIWWLCSIPNDIYLDHDRKFKIFFYFLECTFIDIP